MFLKNNFNKEHPVAHVGNGKIFVYIKMYFENYYELNAKPSNENSDEESQNRLRQTIVHTYVRR